ncbi:MAG TPA: hypothetical protein VLJ68_14290 [Chitinophagaceae bacterium]|nr:hypothetical protein [Chitinophagaceae bacterium]
MKAIFLTTVLALSSILLIRCSSEDVDVPGPLQGIWVEDSVKNDAGWDKSNGDALLRFEKQAKKANVFKGNLFDPVENKFAWSDSFALKSAGKNAWTFKIEDRKVSVKMNAYGHLIVKGLFMHEKDPVEQIFVKKEKE